MGNGDVRAVLAKVTGGLAGGGEDRPGQADMAEAVGRAIATGRHLVVQAGTGTGKSLAYLVPGALAGRKVVVATATKALQDQLAGKDLPFVASHLDRPLEFALLKGRSNYLCRQRLIEALEGEEQLELDDEDGGGGGGDRGGGERTTRTRSGPVPKTTLVKLAEWATETRTGDRAELSFEPGARTWSAVSMSARECPGASRCPQGGVCFAEMARSAAAEADVVVVNLHLYGLHLASGGVVLPEHEVVVIDEAHQLEEVVSSTSGLELSGRSFLNAARAVRAILADERLPGDLEATAGQLDDVLGELVDQRLRRLDEALSATLAVASSRLDSALAALRKTPDSDAGDATARKQRAVKLVGSLIDEVAVTRVLPPEMVGWVEGPEHAPTLRLAPLDVATVLDSLWSDTTAILTSATVPPGLPVTLGMPADRTDVADVGSPFDYPSHAVLYCAAALPDPRASGYEAAMHDELAALIEAAGGRTLALFTSWRAMEAAVAAMRARLDLPILDQSSLPKPALVAAFAKDEPTCLFATMGFWQGVDVAGPTLSLVTIDRLPFPRPDEPLLQARRERARERAFSTIDLPRASMLLAQGAGRLIRRTSDRGVVAVLDPRLATARYRWDIVNALPPMRRTRHRAEVEAFLQEIITVAPGATNG